MKGFLICLLLVTGAANAKGKDSTCMDIMHFINAVISLKEVGMPEADAIDMVNGDPNKIFIIQQTYADNTHTRKEILIREMLLCNKSVGV